MYVMKYYGIFKRSRIESDNERERGELGWCVMDLHYISITFPLQRNVQERRKTERQRERIERE